MKKINLALAALFFGVLLVVSCGSKDSKKDAKTDNTEVAGESETTAEEDKNFEAIGKAVDELKKELPVKLDGDITMSTVDLNDDYLVFEYLLDYDAFEKMDLTDEKVNSDEFNAGLIKTVPSDLVDLCVDAAIGINIVYLDSENREELINLVIPLDKLESLR